MWREAIKRLEVVKKGGLELPGELGQRQVSFVDAFDDFVINVGDVHHVMHGVALKFQVTPDQVTKDESAPVADMCEVVNRWPAAVHGHITAIGCQGNELLHRAGQCVEQV
jgi:hypothetical protein